MKGYWMILLSIAVFVISCNKHSETEKTVRIDTLKFEDGRIQSISTFNDSILHGEFRSFYANGNLEAQALYVDGLLQDTARYYSSEGHLDCIVVFKDSVLNGETQCFYPNGDLRNRIKYKNGLKDGITTYYYKGGVIEAEESFLNGIVTGHTLYYRTEGSIYKYMTFDFEGRLRFIEEYDSLANLSLREGDLLAQYYIKNDRIIFIHSMPPETYLQIMISAKNGVVIDSIQKSTFDYSMPTESLFFPLEYSDGILSASLYDANNSSLIMQDTIEIIR